MLMCCLTRLIPNILKGVLNNDKGQKGAFGEVCGSINWYSWNAGHHIQASLWNLASKNDGVVGSEPGSKPSALEEADKGLVLVLMNAGKNYEFWSESMSFDRSKDSYECSVSRFQVSPPVWCWQQMNTCGAGMQN